MPRAQAPHPHPRQLDRRVVLLAPLLFVALVVGGCALPLSRTTTTPTLTPTFTCTPPDTHDQVLRSGALIVKAPYGDVLHYVDDATTHPYGDLVTFWTNDVLAPNPELQQYVPNRQALAVALGSSTPDDFRCVVTDMERAGVPPAPRRAAARGRASAGSPGANPQRGRTATGEAQARAP